jgi:rubrerythrin
MYQNHFDKLNDYFKEEKEDIIKKEECCDNPMIIKDNTYIICENCGTVHLDNYDIIKPNKYLNQRFHNCTLINSSMRFKNIRRLHHFSNYSYMECTMLKSFKEMLDICNYLKLGKKVIEGSKIKYKEIFLDRKISSRSNIKRAMYCYCINYSCDYYNVKINIEELLKISKIDIKHYNKVLQKLEKKNIIYNNKKIEKIKYICRMNNLDINIEKLLDDYKVLKDKKIKLNNNSILLGLLYEMLEITESKFIKLFKTTRITLNKYKSII